MLYIVASCHCMQFQGTLTNQTRDKGKKPNFRPDFGSFWPKLEKMIKNLVPGLILAPMAQNGPQNLISWVLALIVVRHCSSYHCMQFQGKLICQTWENGKKPSFGPNYVPFGPNLGTNFFFQKSSLVARWSSIIMYNIGKN